MQGDINDLIDLNPALSDIYPHKSIHSIEIEKEMPIWDGPGEADFSAMLRKQIKIVFVCFINRSGSNYLLDLIAQLGFGAKPTDEAFNSDQVIARCRRNNISSFAGYLAKIVMANAKDGFCFLKIGGEQLFWLTKHGLLSRMISAGTVPRFIFMSRADKIAQAVSFFIAETTGRFSEAKGGDRSDDEPLIEYDAAKILSRLRYVDYQAHLFSLFFTLHGLDYLPITYETLLADPNDTLREILSYVGAEDGIADRLASIDTTGKTLVRQGGALNRDLIDRFRNDFRLQSQAPGLTNSDWHVESGSGLVEA